MRAATLRSWLFALLSAALLLLPFPISGPVPQWRRALCWIALVPLLHALRLPDRNGRLPSVFTGAAIAYACGALWFAGNCYWIFQALHVYGLPRLTSALALIPFCFYLGLYFALFGFLFAWIQRRSPSGALVLAPFLWVAIELARARITGFPWDLLGYTLTDHKFLTRLAPVTGVLGLSLVVAAVNALWLGSCVRNKVRLFPPALACSLAVLLSVVGAWRRESGPRSVQPSHTAVLLQDNLQVGATGALAIPESREQKLRSFVALSQRASVATQTGPDLILWPEAPTDFVSSEGSFRERVGSLALQSHAAVIADSVTILEGDGKSANHISASFFGQNGQFAGRYDKIHLVPFGEYVPFPKLFFFAGHLLDGVDFVPGANRNLFSTGGHHYGVFICYESVFGDEVREFAKSGADVLVNLTDDGWYGDTSAPWQHLDMARMRAMENHRWLLRDTNTGITAAISPDGVVHEALQRHVRAAQQVHFDYCTEITFYTRWGDWVGWLCTAIIAASLLWLTTRPHL